MNKHKMDVAGNKKTKKKKLNENIECNLHCDNWRKCYSQHARPAAS